MHFRRLAFNLQKLQINIYEVAERYRNLTGLGRNRTADRRSLHQLPDLFYHLFFIGSPLRQPAFLKLPLVSKATAGIRFKAGILSIKISTEFDQAGSGADHFAIVRRRDTAEVPVCDNL